MSGRQFSFPILSTEQVLSCMEEYGIPLTEQDVKKPQPEKMAAIYDRFVEDMMGVFREDLQQPQFGALDAFEQPELHEESVPQMLFNRALFHLMDVCGVVDFSVRDILRPEYQRTRKILSALINFEKFRQQQLQEHGHIFQEQESVIEALKAKEMKVAELRQQVALIRQQQALEQPQIDEAQEEIDQIVEEIAQLNQLQANMRAEISQREDEIKKVEDDLATENLHILDARAELEDLQTKVVQSPVRIKKEISEMQKALELNKEGMHDQERKARDLLVKLDNMQSVEDDLKRVMKYLEEDVQTETQSLDDAIQRVESLTEGIARAEKELQDYAAREQQLKRQHENLLSKLARVESSQKQQRTDTEETLRRLRQEREQVQLRLADKENKARTLQAKNNAIADKHRQQMDMLHTLLADLCDRIDNYQTELENAYLEA